MATEWEADEKILGVGGRVRAYGQLGFGRNTVGRRGELSLEVNWEVLP